MSARDTTDTFETQTDTEDPTETPRVGAAGFAACPDLWLDDLMTLLYPKARCAFFSTCRTLQQLVLHHAPSTALTLHLPAAPSRHTALASVVTACSHAQHVKLTLCMSASVHLDDSAASGLMHGAMTALGGMLTSVKEVTLECHGLVRSLVPTWLSLTCPALRSLSHVAEAGVTWDWSHSGAPPVTPPDTLSAAASGNIWPVLPDLEQLDLGHTRDSTLDMEHMGPWIQQLNALPGLKVFKTRATSPLLLAALAATTAPITQLSISVDLLQRAQRWWSTTQQSVPDIWPQRLLTLDLTGGSVTNNALVFLLATLPPIGQLSCRDFEPVYRFHNRQQAPWQRLAVDVLNVAHFERLPLQSVQLAARGNTLDIQAPMALAPVETVVEAVSATGGIRGVQHCRIFFAPPVSEGAIQTLALVALCTPTRLALDHAVLSHTFMDAMVTHLKDAHTIKELCLQYCSWKKDPADVFPAQGVVARLLPSLPVSVEQLDMVGTFVTEEELVQLCVHATRPVRMCATARMRWPDGWERRVQAAMRAAGHTHVTLQVTVRPG